jgi:hypothetical protein
MLSIYERVVLINRIEVYAPKIERPEYFRGISKSTLTWRRDLYGVNRSKSDRG